MYSNLQGQAPNFRQAHPYTISLLHMCENNQKKDHLHNRGDTHALTKCESDIVYKKSEHIYNRTIVTKRALHATHFFAENF